MEAFNENPIRWILIMGNVFFMLSIFVLMIYTIVSQGTTSRTKRYKFVSVNEPLFFKSAVNIFTISIAIYTFVIAELSMGLAGSSGYMLSGLIGVLLGYIFNRFGHQYLRYYHAFILEKKLSDIRFKPMISRYTGNEMTLLNEKEEDVYLSKEMIEEEETSSVDYDVWVDDATGYRVIERYDTRFHAQVCNECHFRTLTEKESQVVLDPTEDEKGVLRKFYECNYCDHIETRDYDIPSLNEEKQMNRYDKDIVETI